MDLQNSNSKIGEKTFYIETAPCQLKIRQPYMAMCPHWEFLGYRDQSRYVPSQWETSLQCNDISHWLGEHLDWSLRLCWWWYFNSSKPEPRFSIKMWSYQYRKSHCGHKTVIRLSYPDMGYPILLTHWGWDKMDAIFQTRFSNGFSWMKMHEFWLKFHWNLFLGI